MPALAGGEQHDAARLADGERAARVGAEVEVLDRHRVGLVLVDQLAHPRVDRREAPRRSSAGGVSITPPSSATSRPRRCATTP